MTNEPLIRNLCSLALLFIMGCGLWLGQDARAQGGPEKADAAGPSAAAPKSRADWPTERVIVVGRRGSIRDWLVNHTFRGTEGFADGSAPADVGSRFEFYWQVYYMPGGRLEAHFQRIASPTPHAPMQELGFVEFGTWRITDDGDLCQTIPKVGFGVEICYWVERRGNRVAMYYTNCGYFNRCYVGRLGPEGEIVPGRAFTR